MKKEYKQLKEIIRRSQNILILTHKGPDFDAFCSALILKKYLNTKYPKKNVVLKSRQKPTQNIPFMNEIQVVERIEYTNEDLILITDAANLDMCITDKDTISVSNNLKVVSLDHHDTLEDGNYLTINNNMSSATEQVIDFCREVDGKRFKITKEISILGQIGIIADTGRFLYENATPNTFELMYILRKIHQMDIEEFEYKNSKFPIESLKAIQIYMERIESKGDMAYTYITKGDIQKYNLNNVSINSADQFVRDNILRSIQGIHWGFIIKPSTIKENEWNVSFRSTKGYQTVEKIAKSLNGGGHEYSAATRIEGDSAEDIVKIVLSKIEESITLS